jgi:hypothetical protein
MKILKHIGIKNIYNIRESDKTTAKDKVNFEML